MLLLPQLVTFLFARNTNVNCLTQVGSVITNYYIIIIVVIEGRNS